MGENSFINKSILYEIFRQGRFKPKPTLTTPEIYGGSGYPVEAVIADGEGAVLGCCWQSDLEDLLKLAEDERDTVLSNPNIHVVTAAISEMKHTRVRVAEMAVDIERQHATTVIPFLPRPR